MSLQDKLDAFRADIKARKPPFNALAEIQPVMEPATSELIASGQAGHAIKAGDRAPHFNLKDQDGNDVSSAALLVKGPLVVTFYRGVWCPYCNIELQAINEVLPEIQAYGTNVVAISPQTPVNSRKSVRTNELGFPVLSDVNGQTGADFGLRFVLPDYLVDLYKNLKNDLPAFNNDPSWTLPMPAALRHRTRRDRAVFGGQPGLHASSGPSDMFPVLEKATANA